MIRLAVVGAAGRMGRAVIQCAVAEPARFTVAAALVASEDPCLGQPCPDIGSLRLEGDLTRACDAVVDFSLPAGTVFWLGVCRDRGLPFVSGVTGLNDRQSQRIVEAADHIPIVQADNFSLGIEAIRRAIQKIRPFLGAGYDVEIVETHHRHKRDAPSGTAELLVKTCQAATTPSAPCSITHGRRGDTGHRPDGQIGVHSLRMGDVVGQHEVHFSGPGETVTLRHTATSRSAFAQGALAATEWIIRRPPGLYTLADVCA